MTIEELIIISDFTELEKNNLLSICNQKKISRHQLEFTIDSNLDYSRFNCKNSIIRLKKIDYSTIIHELLHAELVYIYNFPCINEIDNILCKFQLNRLKNLIFNISNDIHHFIFYEKFINFTNHINNVKLVNNEEQLINPSFKFNFLSEKMESKENSFEKITFFYNSLFIPLKYKQLLRIGNLDWNLVDLKRLSPELLNIFNSFFDTLFAVHHEYQTNRSDPLNQAYEDFFLKIKSFTMN